MAENMLWRMTVGIFWMSVYWVQAIFRFFVPLPRKNVEGEIVLITGAGSGLGQNLALSFAKLGCTVVGWDISESGLNQTKKLFTNHNLSASWRSYICDITDRHCVYDVAKQVKSEVGGVDILINNAGIVTGKHLLECRDELLIKTMEVNCISHFWTLKAFLPRMVAHNHGHVVTIASGAGLFGLPGQVDYAASKFGAVGLNEAVAMELSHLNKKGVNVTLVCPYYINTGMFDGVDSPLLKIIPVDVAVSKIVDAVLRNQAVLYMPRLFYFLYACRGIMPVKVGAQIAEACGVLASMDSFKGRKKE